MNDESTGLSEQFSRLAAIVSELRRRCPWDREQTIATLGKHLVEEAYEALDAIESGHTRAIIDELGDLFAQILAIAVIAQEERRFALEQVFQAACDKLIRRHPHVYGDLHAGTASEVVENWNHIKHEERRNAGASSALDGIARALPALARAEKLGTRARQAGMDWRDIHEVLAKVSEEMDEVEGALAADDAGAAAAELGDMLLALANAPRFIGHDAEETLRHACDKFTRRFMQLERLVAERGGDIKRLTPDEVDALWRQTKASGQE